MLELKNIYKTFNPGTVNEKVALNGLELTLEEGDFVTVIGGNGAGKSTMLNAVAGVWPIDMGRILIDGQDITRLDSIACGDYGPLVYTCALVGSGKLCQVIIFDLTAVIFNSNCIRINISYSTGAGSAYHNG